MSPLSSYPLLPWSGQSPWDVVSSSLCSAVQSQPLLLLTDLTLPTWHKPPVSSHKQNILEVLYMPWYFRCSWAIFYKPVLVYVYYRLALRALLTEVT